MPRSTPLKDIKGILSTIDSRTKVLALICVLAEIFFAASLCRLPSYQIVYGIGACLTVFLVAVIAIYRIEMASILSTGKSVTPSLSTPSNLVLDKLINGALHTVCRAVSVPETPESAKLRVFIFQLKNKQLVCSHYWSPNPVQEHVGKLHFAVTSEVASRVAVVQAVVDEKITRTPVEPLPDKLEKESGKVSNDLQFVLAAPIRNRDGSIWGTVDFDAGNSRGRELLSTEVSDAAVYQLSLYLQEVISIGNDLK